MKDDSFEHILDSLLYSLFPKAFSLSYGSIDWGQGDSGPIVYVKFVDGPIMQEKIDMFRKQFYANINVDTPWRTPIIGTPKCECGMEKHGFANHSQWCDMADGDNK